MPTLPLNYRSPERRDRPPSGPHGTHFLVGFIVGNLVSAFVWLAGWGAFRVSLDQAIWTLVGGKALAGVLLMFLSKWHLAGVGLIVSIATGALIFLGGCFMHFRM
jgi:hypothetical protein